MSVKTKKRTRSDDYCDWSKGKPGVVFEAMKVSGGKKSWHSVSFSSLEESLVTWGVTKDKAEEEAHRLMIERDKFLSLTPKEQLRIIFDKDESFGYNAIYDSHRVDRLFMRAVLDL